MLNSFFTDQKIAVRLFLAVAIPMTIMLAFAGKDLYGSFSTFQQMSKIDRLASLSPALTNLVHELQKERGASAGFISSKGGQSFSRNLTAQKELTDKVYTTFNQALKTFDKEPYGPEFSSLLNLSIQKLGKLHLVRTDVGDHKLTVSQMAAYYTGTIARLLNTVGHMSHLSPDPTLTNQISAYTSFLQAKERAGQERAMGAAGFGVGQFTPRIYKKFSALIAQQTSLIDTFFHSALPDHILFYKTKMAANIVSTVEKMRIVGLDSIFSTNSQKLSVGGPEWFTAITEKINLMKQVENRLSQDIVGYAKTKASAKQQSLFVALAFMLTVTLATIIFVTKIIQRIVQPITTITTYMTKLAHGDHSAELELTSRKDEIGDMVKSVMIFRGNSQEKEKLEHETRQKNLKAEIEKEVSSIRHMAVTMEELNSIAFNMSILENKSVQVSSSSQMIASAAEELVASVDEISANSEGASSDAMETDRTIADGLESAQSAMGAIQIIWDTMGASVHSLEELTEASNQIAEILDVIENIAEQTNLLALNATIEAARAGEAGKGFAVVASEVKNLANQSSKATEDIAIRIQALKDGMENIANTMEKSSDAVETGRGSIEDTAKTMGLAAQQISSVSSKMTEITSILHQQKDSSSEIARNINGVADLTNDSRQQVEFVTSRMAKSSAMMTGSTEEQYETRSSRSMCEIAKVDHILFKKKIIEATMGQSARSQNVPDLHACGLGKWYDHLNQPKIAALPAFKRLKAPHEAVHEAANKAMKANGAGHKDDAFAAIEVMNKSGDEVLAILDQLSQQVAELEENTADMPEDIAKQA